MSNGRTIFVSVASYCDQLLLWTIRKAWDKAARRDRIVFGIVDQSPSRAGDDLLQGPWSRQLRYVHVLPRDSRGACWARSVVFSLYAGEDNLLQIDAHTLFEESWDARLIDALEAVAVQSRNLKIALSTRPFGFDLDRDEDPVTKA
jgi:hypothetical protein